MKTKPGPKPTHPKSAFIRVRVSERDRDAFLSASCKAEMSLSEWVLHRCRGDEITKPVVERDAAVCALNAEKLVNVLKRVGGAVYGAYSEASVTVGEFDGVVYRINAMSAMLAADKDCADAPDWAMCVAKAEGGAA